ncbi:MAG: malic enzyme-like NAD(P)-binding protein, partial [bacterium]
MARKPTRDEALEYHARDPPGKTAVVPTKPSRTQWDLSLAYTPGVAEPCRAIAEQPDEVFRYTNRANTVAVVTNGTAVLGLGEIGPLAAKPVMEGKAVLFRRFGDVNAIDIEIDETDPERFVDVVRALAPSFGGINLEDVKAPDCFVIEPRLQQALDIPVFHDDQHGTAIIAGAALLNALEIAGKSIADVEVVFSGAGAAALGCARFFGSLGMPRKHMLLVDSKGVVHKGRKQGMNEHKAEFARTTDKRTLADAMEGA